VLTFIWKKVQSHFVILLFGQLTVLTTCFVVSLLFCHFAVLSIDCLDILLAVKAASYYANLILHQLAYLPA
jgi:hypothetical protein